MHTYIHTYIIYMICRENNVSEKENVDEDLSDILGVRPAFGR
jgi:hypothetical protein